MQHIGQIVSSHIRQNDLAIRYDAATIALVLTDTSEQSGVLAGKKLRRVLASMPLPGSDTAPRATTAVAEPRHPTRLRSGGRGHRIDQPRRRGLGGRPHQRSHRIRATFTLEGRAADYVM